MIPVSTDAPLPPTSVAWLEWGPDAFALAAAEGRPVLLSITASWCHGCAVMDRTSYSHPDVIRAIADGFVPVRIDADRRPDVNDRYNLEGWPTTAVLTASGEMLTGTTYLPPDGLGRMLAEVAEAYASGRDALDARAAEVAAQRRSRTPASAAGVEPDLLAPTWIARRLVDECDPDHGGFGGDGKFLHVAALVVGLGELERTADPALGAALTRTLDGMAGGDVHDQIGGGFFRYAAGADWSRPHTEKMLDDQVGLASVYLEAARVWGPRRWRDVAREIIGFVTTTLADPAEARFFGSQAADEAYYQLGTGALRRTLDPPPVDHTSYTDATARAAAAWIRAGALLEQPPLAELGERALDRLVALTYEPGLGVAHWFDGRAGARGLLADQVHTAWALLVRYEATGAPASSRLAEELMRTTLRLHWDPEGGGFFDRVPGQPDAIGLVADPLKPLAANCVAARTLARLARLTGDLGLHERALDTLRAQTVAYRQQGLFGAPYALAVAEVTGAT
jgi:uncharacterized protein